MPISTSWTVLYCIGGVLISLWRRFCNITVETKMLLQKQSQTRKKEVALSKGSLAGLAGLAGRLTSLIVLVTS